MHWYSEAKEKPRSAAVRFEIEIFRYYS